jgi:hypothetical protein
MKRYNDLLRQRAFSLQTYKEIIFFKIIPLHEYDSIYALKLLQQF